MIRPTVALIALFLIALCYPTDSSSGIGLLVHKRKRDSEQKGPSKSFGPSSHDTVVLQRVTQESMRAHLADNQPAKALKIINHCPQDIINDELLVSKAMCFLQLMDSHETYLGYNKNQLYATIHALISPAMKNRNAPELKSIQFRSALRYHKDTQLMVTFYALSIEPYLPHWTAAANIDLCSRDEKEVEFLLSYIFEHSERDKQRVQSLIFDHDKQLLILHDKKDHSMIMAVLQIETLSWSKFPQIESECSIENERAFIRLSSGNKSTNPMTANPTTADPTTASPRTASQTTASPRKRDDDDDQNVAFKSRSTVGLESGSSNPNPSPYNNPSRHPTSSTTEPNAILTSISPLVTRPIRRLKYFRNKDEPSIQQMQNSYNALIRRHADKGETLHAQYYFDAALRLGFQPDQYAALNSLRRAYLATGHKQQAQGITLALMNVYMAHGEPIKALQIVDQCPSDVIGDDLLISKAKCYLQLMDSDASYLGYDKHRLFTAINTGLPLKMRNATMPELKRIQLRSALKYYKEDMQMVTMYPYRQFIEPYLPHWTLGNDGNESAVIDLRGREYDEAKFVLDFVFRNDKQRVRTLMFEQGKEILIMCGQGQTDGVDKFKVLDWLQPDLLSWTPPIQLVANFGSAFVRLYRS